MVNGRLFEAATLRELDARRPAPEPFWFEEEEKELKRVWKPTLRVGTESSGRRRYDSDMI